MSFKKYGIYGIYKFAKMIGLKNFLRNATPAMNIVTFHRVCKTTENDLTITNKSFENMISMFTKEYRYLKSYMQ